MRLIVRTGIRVIEREDGTSRDFAALEFEVLSNGALAVRGPERMTYAPGAWLRVSYILAPSDLADSQEGNSAK